MIKILFFLMTFLISGCAGLSVHKDSDPNLFYERKAAMEMECKNYAQNLYPGYPAKRGVLTNYLFTRAYDQCLQKKAFN